MVYDYYRLYLKVSDLQGKTVTVKVSRVSVEAHYSPKAKREENCIVLDFEGKKRALILNRGQADDMTRITNEEDETRWVGTEITLAPVKGLGGRDTIKVGHKALGNAAGLFKGAAVMKKNQPLEVGK